MEHTPALIVSLPPLMHALRQEFHRIKARNLGDYAAEHVVSLGGR